MWNEIGQFLETNVILKLKLGLILAILARLKIGRC